MNRHPRLFWSATVAAFHTRIISDLHYADPASRVSDLAQLGPLLDDTRRLLCNGDTMDTRPGPAPAATAAARACVETFARQARGQVDFITGNHDPDISDRHFEMLAGGEVLVTHGDILYDSIVPWGRDAWLAGKLVQELRGATRPPAHDLHAMIQIHRDAARQIPQRHQAERNGLKYLAGFLGDTLWPLDRIGSILKAWRQMPALAQRLIDSHSPGVRFLVIGHTHRPGIWRLPHDRVLINTGSFCPPTGSLLVDLSGPELLVRRIVRRRGDFHAGRIVARFALTPGGSSAKPRT